jgi:predicted Zn-dependent protease
MSSPHSPHSPCLPVLVLITLAACATNPATGKREISFMSEAQEIQIGQEMDQQVRQEMGVYDDRELQSYVEDIGLRLARNSHRPKLPWHFTIVDVPAVNAFALPGGYIYITRGILAYLGTEAELAGVLGHEIGHVTARHAAQAYSRATGAQLGLIFAGIFVPQTRPFGQLAEGALGLLFLKYGREDELESDRLGAEYAAKTGWNPRAVPDFLTTLARISEATDRGGVPNWLSTHPMPADRVARVQDVVARLEAAPPGSLATRRDEYLQRIDGLVFGDNPQEGIIRGRQFLHPEMRFALDFPDGWEISNGKTQVVAEEPGGKSVVLVQLVEQPQGASIEAIADRHMRDAGFRQVEGGRRSINGLDAYAGTYEGRMQSLGDVRMRAAHIAHQRFVFMVAGISPRDLYAGAEPSFVSTIASFRALSRNEAVNVRPNRIDFHTVRAGDTWQSIAAREGGANVPAVTLALMNGSAPSQQPAPGTRVKIVVAG